METAARAVSTYSPSPTLLIAPMRRSLPIPTGPISWAALPQLLLLALMCVSGLSGCNSSPSKRALQYMNQEGFGRRVFGNAEEEEYVSIGDRISILDTAHPEEIDFQLQVAADGTILLKEVGRINVAGFTRSDLKSVLSEKYSAYFRDAPEIVVDISSSARVFWVLGEVDQEGQFPFKGNQNIIDAIVAARPKKDTANLGRIMLIRADPKDPLRLPFNFNDLAPGGDSTTNYVLQENDIIWVPPTLVAEFGYFLRKMLFPVTAVFQAVGGALFAAGGRNNNQGNRALGVGGFF